MLKQLTLILVAGIALLRCEKKETSDGKAEDKKGEGLGEVRR